MYDELVKRLRETSIDFGESDHVSVMLIEAADAIEELQQYADLYKDLTEKSQKVATELKRQLQKSEEDNVNLTGWLAEEHAKHLWIPVTERLPEENEVVLVADKANDIGMGSLQPLWHGVVWVVPFEDVDNEFCPISHWMPLPEPPKDGET